MILFNSDIVEVLQMALSEQYLDSTLLSSCGIGFKFCDVKIHCNERVIARIDGKIYEWDDSPNSAPWGNLVRQQFSNVCLSSPSLLKITLQSGDYIKIETLENQYESVIINFSSKGKEIIMEIF
ncbi:hypothetical protein [Shewanella sp. 10N.286.48.A6]|uniref:hypothetical protein n=1 Tax=Shewanella sp. 10N.286.48.A6 TaxID=1880833 RepID=UPI000CBB354F|nr:hypothetical protein [Shewanella sp. 10N.286.48.A6]PMH96971.1 hypothetical protein BCU55_02565 [Shewanella sp. 10N.286.48.A6]